jgi:hypothetical protein
MGVESYALGADVEYPNDVSLGGTITATPGEGVDGFNIGIQIGDTSTPEGVESVVTQSWRLLDGSTREIDLPRISAKKANDDARAAVGVTALFEPLGEDAGLTAQPHVSLSAGLDEHGDEAIAVRGGATLLDDETQFTGSVTSSDGDISARFSDYATGSSNPNDAFDPNDVQVSSDSAKDLTGLNENALDESLGLLGRDVAPE